MLELFELIQKLIDYILDIYANFKFSILNYLYNLKGKNMEERYKKIYLNSCGNENYIYWKYTLYSFIGITIIAGITFIFANKLTFIALIFGDDKEKGIMLIKILFGHILSLSLFIIFIDRHKFMYGRRIGENSKSYGATGECERVCNYNGYGKELFNVLYIMIIDIVFFNSILFNWFNFNVFLLYLVFILILLILTYVKSRFLLRRNRTIIVPYNSIIKIILKNSSEEKIFNIDESYLRIQSCNDIFIHEDKGLCTYVFSKDNIEKIVISDKIIRFENGQWMEII